MEEIYRSPEAGLLPVFYLYGTGTEGMSARWAELSGCMKRGDWASFPIIRETG